MGYLSHKTAVELKELECTSKAFWTTVTQDLNQLFQFRTIAMADISKLQSDLGALKQSVLDLDTAVDAKVAALQAQIAALQVGQVTQDQIDALDAAATDIQSTVTAETDKVNGVTTA